MSISERHEAALDRLVDSGELTTVQAAAVRREFLNATEPSRTAPGWLVEVGGYVGGGLMLAGVAAFLASSWSELSRGTRAAVFAGSALVVVAAFLVITGGMRAARRMGPARRRAAGVLLSLTAIPAASAVGVAATSRSEMWAYLTGLAVSVACLAVLSNALGVVVAAAMSVGAVYAVAGDAFHAPVLGVGAAIVGLGSAWAAATLAGLVRPRPLGLVLGLGLALVGAQLPIAGESRAWAYGLTLAVSLGCLALYRRMRSLIALASGVIGVTLAVPEAIADVTNGVLDAAGIVLVTGAVLVGASATGMLLHRRSATGTPAVVPGVDNGQHAA